MDTILTFTGKLIEGKQGTDGAWGADQFVVLEGQLLDWDQAVQHVMIQMDCSKDDAETYLVELPEEQNHYLKYKAKGGLKVFQDWRDAIIAEKMNQVSAQAS